MNKNITNTNKENYYQSKFNENLFLDDLSIQNFGNTDDPNIRFTELTLKYEACVKRHMPLKKMSIKERQIRDKPWMTKEILKKIKIRNKLFANKKKDINNEHLKSAYNKFRNSVNNDIKMSKTKYYNTYFESCQTNMKKTWKGINELISNSNKSTHISQIQHNNTTISDPKGMADTFNNFSIIFLQMLALIQIKPFQKTLYLL